MKNNALIAALLGIVSVFAAVSSARAQKVQQLVTDIPFEFSVRDKTFKPGRYIIARLKQNSDPPVLYLRRADEKAHIIIPAIISPGGNRRGNSRTAVKFTRYGNRYFLSGISNSAEGFSAEIIKTGTEIRLAKKFKKQNTEIAGSDPPRKKII